MRAPSTRPLIRGKGKRMLVLSRRKGESIAIGENVKITILEQRGNRVRVGIEAPRAMAIRREHKPSPETVR